jgi:hypothetical protein
VKTAAALLRKHTHTNRTQLNPTVTQLNPTERPNPLAHNQMHLNANCRVAAQLSGRRLQNHGGVVHSKGFLLPAPMPSWLSPLAGRVTGDVAPLGAAGGANHVLINSYRPGEGILVRGWAGPRRTAGGRDASFEQRPVTQDGSAAACERVCLSVRRRRPGLCTTRRPSNARPCWTPWSLLLFRPLVSLKPLAPPLRADAPCSRTATGPCTPLWCASYRWGRPASSVSGRRERRVSGRGGKTKSGEGGRQGRTWL